MTFDPQVSEWENPRGAMPAHPLLNQIGRREATRGTETSKYPEEEKSNEIPQVVASERGRGQTGSSNISGVRTAASIFELAEAHGKARRRV